MKIKNAALRLLLIALAFSWPAKTLAQQSKVIELMAGDGGSKIASIHLNDQDLLFEPSDNATSFLFTAEMLFTINHKDKTYSVRSYDELQAMASRMVAEIPKSQKTLPTGPDIELRLTEESDTISELEARKLIKTNGGKHEAEIWVSSQLVPIRLRAAGERLKAVLPNDYWKKMRANPGMMEIIMLYGIPIKMVEDGHTVLQARVPKSSESNTSFQPPPGYRKVEN